MKRILTGLACLLCLSLAACTAAPEPSLLEEDSLALETESPGGNAQTTPPSSLAPNPSDDRIVVADAMMYRGTVESITTLDEGVEMLLRRAAGSGGFASLSAQTDELTKANFDLDDLAPGNYVEVYYVDSLDGNPVHVIAANRLPDADLCVFNGTLVARDEAKNTLELRSLSDSSTIVFHYGDDTHFYLGTDTLEPGEELNIFHSGALTRSLPPQGYALEVRPYSE